MANAITSQRLCSTIDWRRQPEAEPSSTPCSSAIRLSTGAWISEQGRERRRRRDRGRARGEAQVRIATLAIELAHQAAATSWAPIDCARRLLPDRPRALRTNATPASV
jgi:hypothetical protein